MKKTITLLTLVLLPFFSLQAKEKIRYYTDDTIYSYTEIDDDSGDIETIVTYDSKNKIQTYEGAFDGHRLSFKWNPELASSTIDKKKFTWYNDSEHYIPRTYSNPATKTELTFTFNVDNKHYFFEGTINGSKTSGKGTLEDTEFINAVLTKEFEQHVGTAKLLEKLSREIHQKYSK